MHSFVTSKNVKWCHLIWPTLYAMTRRVSLSVRPSHVGIVSIEKAKQA